VTQPITAKDKAEFSKQLVKWQMLLGMQDWRVVPSAKPATKGALAEVAMCDLEARLASIRIGKDWGAAARDPRRVEQLAVHELLHVFLFEYRTACADPRSTDEHTMSVEHRVINTLTRILAGNA
jgi:hypothetical protein